MTEFDECRFVTSDERDIIDAYIIEHYGTMTYLEMCQGLDAMGIHITARRVCNRAMALRKFNLIPTVRILPLAEARKRNKKLKEDPKWRRLSL